MSQEVTYQRNAAGIVVPTLVSTSAATTVNNATVNTATTTNDKSASKFERSSKNKFSSQGGGVDTTSEEASQAAAAAGLPYVPSSVVTQIYNQTRSDPAMMQLQQQMLFFAQLNSTGGARATNDGSGGGAVGSGDRGSAMSAGGARDSAKSIDGSPLALNGPIPQLSAAARAAVNSTGQNIWALVVVALKGAMEDQNETLQYDLNKLQMYGKMSDQMSQYAQLLDSTQNQLDTAIANEPDDNKKSQVHVDMPVQLSFGPSSMFTLDANGNMLATNLAKQVAPQPMPTFYDNEFETASEQQSDWQQQQDAMRNNANPVTAQGLNTKLQIFQQQRDQLQKNIDHWTNQYQSDNEVKNQLVTTITSILKNMYDMQSAVTRNINL